jgi:hypothetical protein
MKFTHYRAKFVNRRKTALLAGQFVSRAVKPAQRFMRTTPCLLGTQIFGGSLEVLLNNY